MDALINKFKEKLISLERSTEEVQAIFKDIFSRIENVEYPVNGDNLKKMLTNLASRLDAIESDISQMKSNITTNSKDIDTHMKNKLLVNGRHLEHFARFDPQNITSDFMVHEDSVTLRLDDKENLSWWIEIDIPKSKLEELLKEMAAR